MKRLVLAAVLAGAMPLALACSCAGPKPEAFLHAVVDKDGLSYIYLPVNARGVLFQARRQLPASGFTIIEKGSGRKLRAVLAPLKAFPFLQRVGPAGGFAAGRTYVFSTRKGERVEVRTGPALVANPADRFTLELDGRPTRKLLELSSGGGSCSEAVGATVQSLRYALPAAYVPYRTTMTYLTEQKFSEGDAAAHADAEPGKFFPTMYQSSSCGGAEFGRSERMLGTELAYAYCSASRILPRQARGRVGLLELEDKLHDTPVIDLRFDGAQGPSCASLQATGLRDVN
jgi:hypothetical protein